MKVEFNEAQVAFTETVLECGLVDLDPLQEWLDQLTVAPADVGEALCQAGLLNEFELTAVLGRQFGISVASDIELEMYAVPHPKIPREVCAELLFVPLSDQDSNPFPLAISNPFDEVGLQYISELLGDVELKVSLSAPSQIRNEITACYGTEEEWAVYLAQQGEETTEWDDDDSLPEVNLADLVDPEESLNTSEHMVNVEPQTGRPSTIPDWSSLSNGFDDVLEVKKLLSDR